MGPTRPAPKPLKSALKKKPTTPSSPSSQPAKSSPTTRSPPSSSSALFPSTKRDKRHIKHAALLSKITKPISSSSQKSKKRQRRRPHNNQKLITSLDSLAAALPGIDDEGSTEQQGGGAAARDQFNVTSRRKSIKSRPGAMKRREKLDRGERERFAKNMAQMVGGGRSETPAASSSLVGVAGAGAGEADQQTYGGAVATAATTSTTSHRWAALRGFIAQTLEQKPELETHVQS